MACHISCLKRGNGKALVIFLWVLLCRPGRGGLAQTESGAGGFAGVVFSVDNGVVK